MEVNLKGKHALVCGASKGIGRACAIALASCGANVTMLARNAEALEVTFIDLPSNSNQKHSYLIADQNNIEDLSKKIHGLVLQYPIDILINNSGGPAVGSVQIAELPDFEKAFRQHVLSAHSITQYVIPHMKEKSFGRIINILSTSVKQPLDNLGVSNTIRAAMANWAKTLSNELASFNITVNNILPGATKTERLDEIIYAEAKKHGVTVQNISEKMTESIPMKRFATPEEIANAVAFLASPLASYITGINLPVDGGRTKSL